LAATSACSCSVRNFRRRTAWSLEQRLALMKMLVVVDPGARASPGR
jgi:hypothetical protein